jgi:hypothetical protein
MTPLQTRLLAARAVRDAQAQERFARELRPTVGIPSQRSAEDTAAPRLTLAASAG